MTCRELVELITDYLDDALPPADRRNVDEHLDACEGCREHLDQVWTALRVLDVAAESDCAAHDVPGLALLLDTFREFRRA